MLKISREEIEEDINEAKKVPSKNKHKNTIKNRSLDLNILIEQVTLCRKISLIDDILISRSLRNSTTNIDKENEEIINMKNESIIKLLKFDDTFIHQDHDNTDDVDDVRSFLTSSLKEISMAEDEERYVYVVLFNQLFVCFFSVMICCWLILKYYVMCMCLKIILFLSTFI